MQRFIFEVIEPFINKEIQQQRRQQHLRKIGEELRAFIKGELIPINKELSKKTRELFVSSSDNEKYKETIDFLEREIGKLRQESASKDNENFKLRMAFDKEKKQFNEQIDELKKEIKKTTRKFQLDIQKLKDQQKEKLIDLKRQHKNQLEKRLSDQINHWQTQINTLKQSYFQEKTHIIQENSKDKSKLIKKYEQKEYALKCESQEQMQATVKDFTSKIDALKQSKGDLQYKLSSQQQKARRLTLQLDIQGSHHRSFKAQFQTTFRELQQNRKRNLQDRQGLSSDYQNLKARMKQQDKTLNDRIRSLQKQLKETIQQKDKLFNETVQTMRTQHRIQIQSMYNNMMEQRQIALTNSEVKHFEQMFQQMKKFQLLQVNFVNLEDQYKNVKKTFEDRINKLENQHDEELSSVIERKSYEYQLSGENSKRQYNNLQSKFTLQIRALKIQQTSELQVLIKKSQQQKAALSNKLIGQYQAMLADQRTNGQIQIKQKLLQFQRKAKTYEKRIAEGEKRKSQLKVTIQRMKLQSQMKIDSMMQVNEKLQSQIQSLHERILQLQKLKSSIVNDYQFRLLLVKNEMDKLKQEFYQRQDQLRANLNQKIIVKNKQMSRFAERIKQETQELMKKNRERVIAIQKQYQQLKRVFGQKTSLPEDIEALRVFHDAYLQRENQLKGQRKKREQLQRQLHSKDAIQKVFATKQAFKRLTVIDKLASTSSKFTFNKQS